MAGIAIYTTVTTFCLVANVLWGFGGRITKKDHYQTERFVAVALKYGTRDTGSSLVPQDNVYRIRTRTPVAQMVAEWGQNTSRLHRNSRHILARVNKTDADLNY